MLNLPADRRMTKAEVFGAVLQNYLFHFQSTLTGPYTRHRPDQIRKQVEDERMMLTNLYNSADDGPKQ